MIRNSTPTSPTGNDVKIETNWAGNSVIDMTGKNAPIMIAKTVAVALIVCKITSRKACAVRERSQATTTKVRKTPTDAASIGEKSACTSHQLSTEQHLELARRATMNLGDQHGLPVRRAVLPLDVARPQYKWHQ